MRFGLLDRPLHRFLNLIKCVRVLGMKRGLARWLDGRRTKRNLNLRKQHRRHWEKHVREMEESGESHCSHSVRTLEADKKYTSKKHHNHGTGKTNT